MRHRRLRNTTGWSRLAVVIQRGKSVPAPQDAVLFCKFLLVLFCMLNWKFSRKNRDFDLNPTKLEEKMSRKSMLLRDGTWYISKFQTSKFPLSKVCHTTSFASVVLGLIRVFHPGGGRILCVRRRRHRSQPKLPEVAFRKHVARRCLYPSSRARRPQRN